MEPLPTVFKQVVFRAAVPMDGWPDHFAIVTAYNPDGLSAEPAVNAGADAMLRAALEKMDLKHFRLTGGSRDEAHQEPGWGFWPATPRQRQTDGASKTTSFSAGTPKVVELDSDCRFTPRGTALALAPPRAGVNCCSSQARAVTHPSYGWSTRPPRSRPMADRSPGTAGPVPCTPASGSGIPPAAVCCAPL